MKSPYMNAVQSLISKKDVGQEILKNLERKNIVEKFFYHNPLSVKAWTELCQSSEYKNYSRSYECALRNASGVASLIQGQDIHWTALGCGEAVKEILFLTLLKERKSNVRLLAVDFSPALLKKAWREAQKAGIEFSGMLADFTTSRHLKKISQKAKFGTKIFSLLGNSLGAFKQKNLLDSITDHMAAGDYLLADGEIYRGTETLSGYKNQANRRFVMAMLQSVGITKKDGVLNFKLEADPHSKGLYRIVKTFKFIDKKTLSVYGKRVKFSKGETIRMPYSYKYHCPAFKNLFSSRPGLETVSSYFSDDRGYILTLCRKN